MHLMDTIFQTIKLPKMKAQKSFQIDLPSSSRGLFFISSSWLTLSILWGISFLHILASSFVIVLYGGGPWNLWVHISLTSPHVLSNIEILFSFSPHFKALYPFWSLFQFKVSRTKIAKIVFNQNWNRFNVRVNMVRTKSTWTIFVFYT